MATQLNLDIKYLWKGKDISYLLKIRAKILIKI